MASNKVDVIDGKAAFTVEDFCKTFSVGKTQFYQLKKEGHLKTRKIGRKTIVRATDAKDWFNRLPDDELSERAGQV